MNVTTAYAADQIAEQAYLERVRRTAYVSPFETAARNLEEIAADWAVLPRHTEFVGTEVPALLRRAARLERLAASYDFTSNLR